MGRDSGYCLISKIRTAVNINTDVTIVESASDVQDIIFAGIETFNVMLEKVISRQANTDLCSDIVLTDIRPFGEFFR